MAIILHFELDLSFLLFLGLSLSGSCIGGLVLAPTIDLVVQNYGWKMAMISMTGMKGDGSRQ